MNIYFILSMIIICTAFCFFTIGIIPVLWMIIGAFISFILYMAWHRWRRRPSKGTFALASIGAILLCFTTGVVSTSDNLFLLIENYLLNQIGLPQIHESSPYPILIFSFAISVLIYLFSNKVFRTWDAPLTVSELELAAEKRDKNLLPLAINQIKLIINRKSDPIANESVVNWGEALPDLPQPKERKDLLKDLLQSYKREINIKDNGWRDDGKYWAGEIFGAETNFSSPLIAFIFDKTPTSEDISRRITDLFPNKINKEMKFFAIYLSESHTKEISSKITVDGIQIEIISSRKMIFESLDLKWYARAILKNFETTQVGGTQITLEDTFVEINVKTKNTIGPLSEKLRKWSENKSNLNIAIIGEYGQGKSTALLKYCYDWAKRFIIDNEIKEKVPLLIELRGRSPSEMDPLAFLSAWCSRYNLMPQQIYNLIKAGEAIVIFEGFDELKYSGRAFDRYQHFNALWRFAYPGTKIIFTGRPNFFLDQSEANRTLRNNSIIHSTGGLCTEIWNIEKFDKNQIKAACRSYSKNIIDGITKSINLDEDFYDILTRPSMLPVVATIWNEIEDLQKRGVHLTGAILIERYIRAIFLRKESELENDRILYDSPTGSRYLSLPRAVRELLTICVAWRMSGAEAQNTIARSEIFSMVKDCYDELLVSGKAECSDVAISQGLVEFEQRNIDSKKNDIIEIVTTEICSAGLLIPDPVGGSSNLRFPHKQFYEFLIARSIFIVSSPKSTICARILKSCSSEKNILRRLNNEKNSIRYLAECSGENLNIFFGSIITKFLAIFMIASYLNIKFIDNFKKTEKLEHKFSNFMEALIHQEVNKKTLLFTSVLLSITISLIVYAILFCISIIKDNYTALDEYKLHIPSVFFGIMLPLSLISITDSLVSARFGILIRFLFLRWGKEKTSSDSFIAFSLKSLLMMKNNSNTTSNNVEDIDEFLYPALNFEKTIDFRD